MAKAVTAARQQDAAQSGADSIYRSLFDSFNPDSHLAVPDFAALSADITRMHDELLPVTSGSVADYIPQLKRVER